MNFLFQNFGGITLPTTEEAVGDSDHLFGVFDPVRDRLLDLLSTALNAELGPAWNKVRAETSLASKSPVEDTLYDQPRRAILREGNFSFPLLALYRSGEATFEWHALDIRRSTQPWVLEYILGPLKVEDYRRVGAVLTAAARIIDLTIERRGHPAFESGTLQFFPDRGGLASVSVRSARQGLASFGEQGEGNEFYALRVELETVEIDGWADDFDPDFAGVGVQVDVAGDGGTLPAVILAETDEPRPENC